MARKSQKWGSLREAGVGHPIVAARWRSHLAAQLRWVRSLSVGNCGVTLADYLASTIKRRWKIGELDCSTFMADWAVARGRPDPIADVRGRYSTEREMLRIVRKQGGFLMACKARLEAIGMKETLVPQEGDIVAVKAPYAIRMGEIQRYPTGALCVASDRFVVVTSDLGLVIASPAELPLLKAWTF